MSDREQNPFVKDLAAKLAQEIYDTLHDRGVHEIPGEGSFCPACQQEMTGSSQIIGSNTKPKTNLWVCMDCAEAHRAKNLVNCANEIRRLPWKEKVALVFNGKVPKTWLEAWHNHCKLFPSKRKK